MPMYLTGRRLELNEHGNIAWSCRRCYCWNEPCERRCRHCQENAAPLQVVYLPTTEEMLQMIGRQNTGEQKMK